MKEVALLLLLPLLLSIGFVRTAKVCGAGVVGRHCNTSLCEGGCSDHLCTSSGRCHCPEGWTGALCDAPVCAPGCSTEHGYCGVPGECRCEVGWWGERCDLCFPYPGCQHGTCEQPWQCVCDAGWSGDLCDTRKAPRGYNATKEDGEAVASMDCGCLNGGTCVEANPPLNYTCSCPALFTGRYCDFLARSSSPRMMPLVSGTLTTSQEQKQKDEAEEQEEDPKVTRRRLLQKHARISFRPVKPGVGAGKRAGQTTPLPNAVGERKLLPLPVVLPRVTEMLPPAFVSNERKHKSVSKQSPATALITGSAQDPVRKNFIPSARGGHLPARPRLVQVLNSQRRPILVSLPAAPLTQAPKAPPTSSVARPPSPDIPPTPFPPTFPGTARPSTAEPRGPINLYPRKITTPPPPITTLSATATIITTSTSSTSTSSSTSSISSNSNSSNSSPKSISRPWPKVALWPPARRQGAITRHYPVQAPPPRPQVDISVLTGRVQSAAVEGHEASGTERLETVRPLPRELEPRSVLPEELDPERIVAGLEDFHIPTAREIAATYYEQNANGRVHIGDVSKVDSAPAREIMDAFIELKKV